MFRLLRATAFRSRYIFLFLAGTTLALTATSASAQIDKVDMDTDGISCGTCALVAEVYLRHLDGVDKVSISKSREHVVVFYKPGAVFHPEDLRAAMRKTGVVVEEFQIHARGEVEEEGDNKFFQAGELKFRLTPSAHLPPKGSVVLDATVNDQTKPMELDVISFTSPKN